MRRVVLGLYSPHALFTLNFEDNRRELSKAELRWAVGTRYQVQYLLLYQSMAPFLDFLALRTSAERSRLGESLLNLVLW